MENEIAENLLLMSKEKAQIYSPGRYLIFTKNPMDLKEGYTQNDINIELVSVPKLTKNMNRIWEERYQKFFPNGVKRAGKFPGMQFPSQTKGKLGLRIFESGYLDWKLTLPWRDEHDSKLERDCMRTYLNIHHVPITIDGHLIYIFRGKGRASWGNSILCTHSWGDDTDKDYAFKLVMDKLLVGNGEALFEQAREGVRREINPYKDSGDANTPNEVLERLLNQNDVVVKSANCLTLHIQPKDMGYIIGFTTEIKKEAGKLLEERNRFPMVGRISEYHSIQFTEERMVEFFKKYANNEGTEGKIATTIEPVILMACIQKFGEDFIKNLSFECYIQK